MINELNTNTITFGKYKDKTLHDMLKDRSYCSWVLKQDWFKHKYEYIYNRVKEYDPLIYFFKPITTDNTDFIYTYKYFNLYDIDEIKLDLTNTEKTCYLFYKKLIKDLYDNILVNKDKDVENHYDIKAPVRWLKRFEKETTLNRTEFKTFLSSYSLINIPYIVEKIKMEGGIEYKGAKSFIIAKQNSEKQETYWENLLKEKYSEDICTQFKFKNCIFDFIHIKNNVIYECKLGIKDFNGKQYRKYRTALEKYNIIYIIGSDCIINMEQKCMYTNKIQKYEKILSNINLRLHLSKDVSKFEKEIKNYKLEYSEELVNVL